MSWLQKNKRVWRLVVLALLFVALLGPWVFERIYVPAKYSCSARLEGDFCGYPMSGILVLLWMLGGTFNSIVELVTGTGSTGLSFWSLLSSLRFILPVPLLVLPIISTLLLILRGDRPRRVAFQVAALVLAVGFDLLWGLNSYPRLFWALWGIWLYILAAASALTLEVLILAVGRKPSSPRNPTAAVAA